MERLPKIVGYDVELGNFLLGVDKQGGSGLEASRMLLSRMPGVMPANEYNGFANAWTAGSYSGHGGAGSWQPPDPRDFGRKWTTSGATAYIDSDHIEIAGAECTNAWDWTAQFYAQLMQVREAQRRATADLPGETAVQVLVCNSDGLGNSWGSHINVLITRRAFRNIFERRMHYLLWLASYQVSSTIVSGLGKVGSEHGRPPIDFQLSQRADFFSEIVSHATMSRRPIINARDEPHCYPTPEFARYHHISNDVNLCQTANLIKVGVLQIVLAMVEAESELVNPSVLLDSPLDAWLAFSRDPSLQAKVRTLNGELVSALDLQRSFLDAATRFTDAGGCEGFVPRAGEILALWSETLDLLEAHDWDRLTGRLDWVLKKRLIEDTVASTPGMTWQSHEAKYLDLMYSSLLAEDGLFWPCMDAGLVEQAVDPQRVEYLMTEPPDDTRAFTRGRLISGIAGYQIETANWDCVRLRFGSPGYRGRIATVYLDSPCGSTAADNPSLAQTLAGEPYTLQADSQHDSIPSSEDKPLCKSKNEPTTRPL